MGVLVLATLLSACTGTPSTPSGNQSTSGGGTSTPPTVNTTGTGPAPAASGTPATTSPVTLRDADRGRTVTVKVGDPVTLTLTGLDWGFTDPNPASVLTPMSPPIVAAEPNTSSAKFRAAKPGT